MEALGNVNTPKAMKRYLCNGWEQLDRHEFEKPCNGIIKKGQRHKQQFIVDGGDCWNWRSCDECFKVIVENELYDY